MSAEPESNVIDLALRREIRRLHREIENLLEQSRRINFENDAGLLRTVVNTQAVQLANRHQFLLSRLRPVLLELIELHAMTFDAPSTYSDSALNIANATAMMLDDVHLITELPARIEKRRGEQFAAYQALLREWGPALFEPTEISKT